MPFTLYHQGAARLIAKLTIQSDDVPRPIRNLWVMTGGVRRLVYSNAVSLTLAISPSPTEGRAPQYSDTAGTPMVTATPTGGQGPYSYSWTVTSFTGSTPTISFPSNASTTFLQSGLTEFDENTCVFACLVTDSLGATASASVTVNFFGPIDRGTRPGGPIP